MSFTFGTPRGTMPVDRLDWLKSNGKDSPIVYDGELQDLKGKRVTVAGLGRFGGGISVARWLVGQGAKVLVTDKDPAEKLADSVAQLKGLPIEFVLGEHHTKHFVDTDLIVASPAIPPTQSLLVAARDARVPITTEIRLFIERCPSQIVGITGTKGKSTTTAMLGRMLETRHKTWVGGNIGKSLLADLNTIQPDDWVVLELSSYMLEHLRLMHWSPKVAVVTMIAADHLEWHGSFDNYSDAKKNLVRHQRPGDYAILSEENEASRQFGRETKAKVIFYGIGNRPQFDLRIAGRHNQINAQAAWAAAQVLGVPREAAQQSLRDFTGLPHRLELVHESAGVKWINDSIATIPEAAAAAADAFPAGTVIQIVGGYDKQLDLRPMTDPLAKKCKAILTIGQTGPTIAKTCRANKNLVAQVIDCTTLANAVARATEIAVPGDTVLLSTGCSSYDQFKNFEDRGIQFANFARSQSPHDVVAQAATPRS